MLRHTKLAATLGLCLAATSAWVPAAAAGDEEHKALRGSNSTGASFPPFETPDGPTRAPPETNTLVPPECTHWYDGCNTCRVNKGVIGGCTRRACSVRKEPRCLQVVKDCTHWNDGCNTCTVTGGKIGECTRKLCNEKGTPHCIATAPSCPTWYDGCNRCLVHNGKITGCTQNACEEYGVAQCEWPSSGCCYTIGLGDEMAPCCLSTQQTNRSSCIASLGAQGDCGMDCRRGWSAECPSDATQAGRWLDSTEEDPQLGPQVHEEEIRP